MTLQFCTKCGRRRISTHTLTWSVTEKIRVDLPKAVISTHTLTWSVTKLQSKHDYQQVISTHTLTWSVTQTGQQYNQIYKHFNSHAHVERDTNTIGISVKDIISTHTLTWSVTEGGLYNRPIYSFQLTRSRGA